MTHIASDLHLDHGSIIEYCDRPFESVNEMNNAIIDNWNQAVQPDERVLFLGDLVPFEDRDHVVQGWLNKLNGDFIFVRGNHDETVPISSQRNITLTVKDRDIYMTHYPEDIPDEWDGWGIYGHHHNNFPEEYPFVDPKNKRINVSIELLGFEPIPITELFTYIEQAEHLTIRPGVDESCALQQRHSTNATTHN